MFLTLLLAIHFYVPHYSPLISLFFYPLHILLSALHHVQFFFLPIFLLNALPHFLFVASLYILYIILLNILLTFPP